MSVYLSPVGGVAAQFFTNNGTPLTGGKLYTYSAGSTTPAATFTSSNGSTAWTNPIVLDAAGRVPGSGEIWLTDSVIYKFILKDSNDVLIATYDNISGINSNFIAFTNQQEIVTATSGQTVFNLGINYQPGTNSLSVFVDGVNQYGPGAQYAYVETDSNTVTFNSGLHVGAEVKFTTSQQQGAGAVDAEQVSYQPPFTGSVATNVEAKLAQTVSVKDFGAVGDGVTDDTAAINTAVTYANSVGGGVVTFPFGTYMVNASGTTTGIQLKTGVYLNLTGAKLKALSFNSPDYRLVWIQEQSNCGVIGGEIEGDKLTTTATSTNAQGHGIYIILNCANVTVQGVKVYNCYGDGIYTGRLCTGTKITNCVLTNNGRNNISVVSSSNVVIDGCDISNANGNLPEAGIDVEPNPGDAVSNNVVITNCHIYGNTNEGISFPAPAPTPLIETAIVANCHIYNNGTQGIRASYVKNLEVTGCVIYGNGAGGIQDTAALATSFNIDGNIIYGNTGSGIEGFSSGSIISNNTIRNNTQWGIKWQFGQHVTIAGNTISDHGEDGISYERAYNCAIVGNTIKNSQKHGIFITGTVTSSVTRSRKVTIEGNTVAFSGLLTDNTYSGIFLDTYANTSVVTGNTVVAGTTGNLPLHAIYAVDASVYVASNQTDGGAKSGNSQVNIGGVSMPSFLNSPNVLSHTYAPRYYLPGLCFITSGTGSPEGALGAPVGSLFLRTDGGAGTTLYVKQSGSSNTGWVAK